MTKVTVTGASGHLGANLVRQLIEGGFDVTALVRRSTAALKGLDVKIAHGDVTDADSLRPALKGAEQVYHLAAYISIGGREWQKLRKVNIEGTHNVLAACQSQGVSTLVHFSSIHVFDLYMRDTPVTEDNPLVADRRGFVSDYDYSKAQAEILIRKNDCASLDTRVLYPTAVIGPNDFHSSLFGLAIQKMANGRLPALVTGGFDWVDARDVAGVAIEAVRKGKNGDRFILSGHYRDMRQVANVIAELTGVPASRFSSPVWLARVFAPFMGGWARLNKQAPLYTQGSLTTLTANKNISHARATDMLGYKPRPFHSSMRDALRFYADRGQVKLINHGS